MFCLPINIIFESWKFTMSFPQARFSGPKNARIRIKHLVSGVSTRYTLYPNPHDKIIFCYIGSYSLLFTACEKRAPLLQVKHFQRECITLIMNFYSAYDKLPNTMKTVKFAVSTINSLSQTTSFHNFGPCRLNLLYFISIWNSTSEKYSSENERCFEFCIP